MCHESWQLMSILKNNSKKKKGHDPQKNVAKLKPWLYPRLIWKCHESYNRRNSWFVALVVYWWSFLFFSRLPPSNVNVPSEKCRMFPSGYMELPGDIYGVRTHFLFCLQNTKSVQPGRHGNRSSADFAGGVVQCGVSYVVVWRPCMYPACVRGCDACGVSGYATSVAEVCVHPLLYM